MPIAADAANRDESGRGALVLLSFDDDSWEARVQAVGRGGLGCL
jgi:hypothetical protein